MVAGVARPKALVPLRSAAALWLAGHALSYFWEVAVGICGTGCAGPEFSCGHSHGGVVITEAGDSPLVSALVYVAAFALDHGKSGSLLVEKGRYFHWERTHVELTPGFDERGVMECWTWRY